MRNGKADRRDEEASSRKEELSSSSESAALKSSSSSSEARKSSRSLEPPFLRFLRRGFSVSRTTGRRFFFLSGMGSAKSVSFIRILYRQREDAPAAVEIASSSSHAFNNVALLPLVSPSTSAADFGAYLTVHRSRHVFGSTLYVSFSRSCGRRKAVMAGFGASKGVERRSRRGCGGWGGTRALTVVRSWWTSCGMFSSDVEGTDSEVV